MLVMVIQVNPTIDKVRLLFSFESPSLGQYLRFLFFKSKEDELVSDDQDHLWFTFRKPWYGPVAQLARAHD